MRAADYAWTGIAVGVLAYEAHASRRDWELLSEACDRYRHKHPVVTVGVVCYLAAHLTRAVPRRVDPLHQLAVRLGR